MTKSGMGCRSAVLAMLAAFPLLAQAGNGVQLSLMDTGNSVGNVEAMVVDGGSWLRWRKLIMTAVLIRHPQGNVLLDTGFGTQVDAHFADNPWFEKLLLQYENVNPAVEQLAAADIAPTAISMIIPTHMHWDHVDALEDFPGVPVWVPPGAVEAAGEGKRSAYVAEQFDDPAIDWRELEFNEGPAHGFAQSRDVFGDGAIVLVPLDSHTAHDVGAFVTTDSGQQYFFIGDISWTVRGVEQNKMRPWLTSKLFPVDRNPEALQTVLGHIHQLSVDEPDLIIVPAHDEVLAATLPMFPDFTQ